MIGPLEYIAVGFEGTTFSEEIVRTLAEVRVAGTLRILDLVVVSRRETGEVILVEVSDLSDAQAAAIGLDEPDDGRDHLGWFSDDDVDAVAAQLPAETSAVVVLIEHVWAAHLRASIADEGGFVVAQGRVATDLVDEVEDLLTTAR